MRKIYSALLLLLVACSSVPTYDTEFKNPIFNQPLEPLGKTSTWTYLTPTSYVAMTPLDKSKIALQGKCDLIENKQDRITLKCGCKWDDGTKYNSYFTYIVKELFLPKCLHIVEYSYSTLEDFPKFASYNNYCVTPPKDMTSKSN